jgi:hypothetical protein
MSQQTTELGFPVDVAEMLEERGIYTAERLRARKPELVAACIKMLGHGIATKMVSEVLGIDIRAVIEIGRQAEAEGAITPYKERTLSQLRAVITLSLDSLVERAKVGKVSPIEVCALIDKVELLSGGVTSRVEVVEDPEVAAFRRLLEAQGQRMGTGSPEISATRPLPASARQPLAGPIIDVPAEASKCTSEDTQCSVPTP